MREESSWRVSVSGLTFLYNMLQYPVARTCISYALWLQCILLWLPRVPPWLLPSLACVTLPSILALSLSVPRRHGPCKHHVGFVSILRCVLADVLLHCSSTWMVKDGLHTMQMHPSSLALVFPAICSLTYK